MGSLVPTRSDFRINSSSTGQRLGGRNRYGHWYRRLGAFRIRQIVFESLDSEIAKSIMEIIPTEFRRKIHFPGRDSKQEQTSNADGQPNHVSNVLVLEHQEDSGATMNLSDLLNVELYNLKMFSQAREETSVALLRMIRMTMSWRTCMTDT